MSERIISLSVTSPAMTGYVKAAPDGTSRLAPGNVKGLKVLIR